MNNLCVWVVHPPGYPHSQCFAEVAESIGRSLDIPVTWGMMPAYFSGSEFISSISRPIILGAHLLPPMFSIPHNSYIYNLEVIGKHTPIPYLDLMRSANVWDYSQQNIQKLKEYGIEAKHVPIGYHSCLTRISPVPEKTHDVLFVGSVNERRSKIMEDLLKAGINAHWAFNCYGKERDDLIARSKIVLNMHYYEDAPFEIVRCSYLMSNKVCVLSETGGDIESEKPYYNGVKWADYSNLVDECLYLLDNKRARNFIANMGYELFTKTSMEANLRGVL